MSEKREHDSLTYHFADGRDVRFGPAVGSYKPVNQPIKRVLLDRGKPDGSLGEWVPQVEPPAPPPPPPRTVRVAAADPNTGRRGDGVTIVNRDEDAAVGNELVVGYEQNIVVKGVRSLALDRVLSHNANTFNPHPANYGGQGGYVERCPGGVRVAESAFLGNGRPFGMPDFVPYQYQHGFYGNYTSGQVRAEYSVFGYSSGAGAQPRAGGRFYRCVFTENSIGLLGILGPVEAEECLFYGGRHYMTGANMAGNMAASTYALMTLTNCMFVGRPDQAGKGNREIPKRYDMGMLNGGREYEHTENGVRYKSPGASWVLQGNRMRVAGTGDRGNAPPTVTPDGVRVVPGGAVALPELDVSPLLKPDADVKAWVERALAAAERVL